MDDDAYLSSFSSSNDIYILTLIFQFVCDIGENMTLNDGDNYIRFTFKTNSIILKGYREWTTRLWATHVMGLKRYWLDNIIRNSLSVLHIQKRQSIMSALLTLENGRYIYIYQDVFVYVLDFLLSVPFLAWFYFCFVFDWIYNFVVSSPVIMGLTYAPIKMFDSATLLFLECVSS
jgi:hypothetical protein